MALRVIERAKMQTNQSGDSFYRMVVISPGAYKVAELYCAMEFEKVASKHRKLDFLRTSSG